MPFRDRLSRMVRRSHSLSASSSGCSNGSSNGHADSFKSPSNISTPTTTTTTTTPSPSTSSGLRSYASAHLRLAKRTTWRISHITSSSSSSSSTTSQDRGIARRPFSTAARKPPASNKRSAAAAANPFAGASTQRTHPRERPLTEQNMRHQEVLGTFTMKFGRSRRRASLGAESSFSGGISPGNSRPASVDIDLDELDLHEWLYGQSMDEGVDVMGR